MLLPRYHRGWCWYSRQPRLRDFLAKNSSGYQIVESGVAYNTSVYAAGAEYVGVGGEDVLADDYQGGASVKFV
jgi:hypothetical protein